MKQFNWKDKETQQSALFWTGLLTFIFWVTTGFNINYMLFGLVSAVLVTQKAVFGGKNENKDDKDLEMDEKTKFFSKWNNSDGGDPTDHHMFRNRFWAKRTLGRL